MGYSTFRWIVVHDDGTSEVVVAETIDKVVFELKDEQPRAIIKESYI